MPAVRKYASAADRQAAYRERCRRRLWAQESDGSVSAASVPPAPGKRRWDAITRHALCLLEQAAEEMQDYYDRQSETWQESEAGESLIERLESMTEIVEVLQAQLTTLKRNVTLQKTGVDNHGN